MGWLNRVSNIKMKLIPAKRACLLREPFLGVALPFHEHQRDAEAHLGGHSILKQAQSELSITFLTRGGPDPIFLQGHKVTLAAPF